MPTDNNLMTAYEIIMAERAKYERKRREEILEMVGDENIASELLARDAYLRDFSIAATAVRRVQLVFDEEDS